jgi:hypothetical protein
MRSSFWNEATLRRQNRGKMTPMQLANERDIARFRTLVSDLKTKWVAEDQQQTTHINESENMLDDKQKNRLRQLVHEHLHNTFRGYDRYEEALKEVLVMPQHKAEFGNIAAVTAEFVNEHREGRPSPVQFRAEVLREQRATGLSYEEAFTVVCERYPGLQHPEFSNTRPGMEAEGTRRERIQELIQEYCMAHGLNLSNPGTYDHVFQRVLAEHPEITNAMVKPMRSNANTWRTSPRDGHTPTNPHAPQGSGTPLRPANYMPPHAEIR